jgi:hypothetical protein
MSETATVGVEDVLPVRSRVSWGAIFAGAMVALALYFLLTLLGAAIGFSVSGRVRPETLSAGATFCAVWALMVSLFVGGYVTSQCSVGENKFESVLYGIILWGVLFGMLMWLMASGVHAGFNAIVGMTHASQAIVGNEGAKSWEDAARRAGVPQQKIDEWRKSGTDTAEQARRATEDQTKQEAAAEAATRVTWWAFLGTLASMLAAVTGAYVGAGPRFRLVRIPYVRAHNGVLGRHPAGAAL